MTFRSPGELRERNMAELERIADYHATHTLPILQGKDTKALDE